MSTGIIQRVVHFSSPSRLPGQAPLRGFDSGYGVIQDEDGHEILFHHTVVQGCRFHDLQRGQQVCYLRETDPLGRAIAVSPVNPPSVARVLV